MKKIIIGIIVIVAVVWGGYALLNKPKQAGGEEIKIGALSHLTGFGNTWGVGENKALLLRAKELQKEGLNIKIISEDCASDIPKCVSAAQKLINIDKVTAIVGPQWTEWFEPIAPLANQYKVVLISPSGLSDQSYQPYAFSLGFPYDGWGRAFLGFSQDKGLKKATVIVTENAFLNKIAVAQKKLADQYDVSIIDEVKVTNPEEKDFATFITKIKQKNPEIIFVDLLEPQIIPFVKKAKEQKLNAVMVHVGGVKIDEQTTVILKGTYMVDFKISDELKKKYKTEYGSDTDIAPSSQTAYDALSLIAEAIKVGAKTSESITYYVRNLKEFKGISGKFSFDKNGFAQWGDIFLVKEIK